MLGRQRQVRHSLLLARQAADETLHRRSGDGHRVVKSRVLPTIRALLGTARWEYPNMTEKRTMAQRWSEYRASKTTLFWSCVVCIILTMVIGFTWGGWVTGGSAKEMAENAASTARTDLAATVCVNKFMNAKGAATELATLKQTSSWKREQFIQDGGWTAMPGVEQPVRGAATVRRCPRPSFARVIRSTSKRAS